MNCPKCNSNNVSIQAINKVIIKNKHHGFVWWLLIGWYWIPIKWIFFTGIALIIKIFSSKKKKAINKIEKMAVCQSCGHSWKV